LYSLQRKIAPVVFFYLLGRCLSKGPLSFIKRIAGLGSTVLFTFGILWEPFVKYAPSEQLTLPPIQRLEHVLRRIFPFQRGLFEGKVSNLWCALNVSPLNIRNRIPTDKQPLLAMLLTVFLMLPSCWKVLRIGLKEPTSMATIKRHWILLLWATTSCALSFFLASFQVHEKSILLALAPCTLLFWQDPLFVEWFSFVCVWSLYPLIQVDRQTKVMSIFSGKSLLLRAIPNLSFVGMIGLHVAQALIPPPSRLPDLYEVLWSVAGCGMFSFAWLVTIIKLYSSTSSGPLTRFKEKAD
jgi:alpha-1,3-glucosyltransferase